MSKHRTHRTDDVSNTIQLYAEARYLELLRFTNIHFRLIDDGFTTVDIWPTTGRYWVSQTEYNAQGGNITERAGEKGVLPEGKEAIYDYFDKLFYAVVE